MRREVEIVFKTSLNGPVRGKPLNIFLFLLVLYSGDITLEPVPAIVKVSEQGGKAK